MLYRTLADITVVFHLAWILFLIFGVFVGLKWRWVRITHICGWVFSIMLQIRGWYCPLTQLEHWLHAKNGWTYTSGFIQHYVERVVYLDVTREIILAASVVVIVVSGWLYYRKLKIRN